MHHTKAYDRPSSASSSSVSSNHIPAGSKPLLHAGDNGSVEVLRRDIINSGLHGLTDRISAGVLLELIYSGWNPDLPEPHILDH